MFLCYLVKLFGAIILTSVDFVVYCIHNSIPDDITCFLNDPFAIPFILFITLVVVVVVTFVAIYIPEYQWKLEKRDFEFRRSTWR
jgi:hypothetical protein